MNFSLIFPTRGRAKQLGDLLKSLQITTEDKDKVEILIAVDNDDLFFKKSKTRFVKRFPELNIRFFAVKRSENFSKDYFNFLAEKTKGKFILALNDDAVFETPGWDLIVLDKAKEYFKDKKDKIVYIRLGDNEIGYAPHGFSCFPALSRKAYKALGFFFNEQYYTCVADRNLFEIFRHIERVLTVDNIRISYKLLKDKTAKHVALLSALHHCPGFDCVTEHAERLIKIVSRSHKK